MNTFENYPDWILKKWQEIADLLAEIIGVPAALIMKNENEFMEVFISSHSENNPYIVGAKEKWSGLYCETVIKTRKKLAVPNALKDKKWDKNPDIKLGMIAYLGFPIDFPDLQPFGTLCILDHRERHFTALDEKLIQQFKNVIELDLSLMQSFELTTRELKRTIVQEITVRNQTAEALAVHQIQLEMQNEELRRVHVELDSERARYFDLYDLAPVGYVTIHENGKILEANLTIAGLLNIERSNLVEKTFNRFILREDADIYLLRCKQLFKTGAMQDFDIRMVKKNGTILWVYLVATLAQVADGIPMVRIAITDITKLKEAERAFRESEEKHRLITQMQQGVAVYEIILDERGKPVDYRFLEVNKSYERLTGLKRENIIGKTTHEILPDTESDQLAKFSQVAITGEPLHYEKYDKELGKYFEVAAYSPQSKQVAFIISDITERKQAEEALRESEEKYRHLHESAGVGVGYYSPDGKVISYNTIAATHMGGKPEDFSGKSIYELFPKMAADVYMDRLKKAAESDENQEYEDKVDLPGKKMWFTSVFTRILNSSNRIIGVQIISIDISVRKQAEESLLEYQIELQAQNEDLYRTQLELEVANKQLHADMKKIEQLQSELVDQAIHDKLTGLLNRYYFDAEMERLQKSRQFPVSILMIDVDGLKKINDLLGHPVGDDILRRAAIVLKQAFRPEDVVARLGGDEFVVILPCTDRETASQAKQRLKNLLQEYNKDLPEGPILSLSIGVASGNKNSKLNEVFSQADKAMYIEKASKNTSPPKQPL